jgi:hypothetical protein
VQTRRDSLGGVERAEDVGVDAVRDDLDGGKSKAGSFALCARTAASMTPRPNSV